MHEMSESALMEQAEQQAAEFNEGRRRIAADLQSTFDDLARKWTPIHARWVDDLRQIEGLDPANSPTKDNATPGDAAKLPPSLQITRSRTAIASARVADMIFPHSDQPWDIDPADDPHVPDADIDPENWPEQRIAEECKRRAEEMQKTVKSQLDECNFVRDARRMIEDSAQIGLGIIKGPVMGLRRRKTHRGQHADSGMGMSVVAVTEVIEESRPEFEYVDPWTFISDLAPTMEEVENAFHIRLMTKRDLRQLSQRPGFDKDAIRKILQEEPVSLASSPILSSYARKNSSLGLDENLRDVYVVLEYHGPIRKEWAEEEEGAFTCSCLHSGQDEFGEPMPFMWQDDGAPLPQVEIFFCQGEVLKFRESVIEGDTRVPFYAFTFQRIDDTFCGGGIPYLLRSIDRAIQASWQMGLHNASVSSGPLIFARRKNITPADGRHSHRGPKLFFVDDDQRSLRDIVQVETIPNNTDQFMALLDKAMFLADEVINLPLIAQGPQSAAQQTATGAIAQINTNNVFQKRLAMNAAEGVIIPAIERLIEWNIAYGDPSIAGDFKVVDRTNVMLVKDVQVQRLQAATMLSGDPRFAPYIDNYELFKRNLELLELPVDGILLPREEAEAKMQEAAQQAPDPMLEVKMAEIETKNRQIDINAEIAKGKMQLDQIGMQSKEQLAQMTLDQAMMALALQENLTFAEIQAGIEKVRMGEQTKLGKIGVDARLQAQKMSEQRERDALQIRVESPNPRLAG